MIDHDKQTENPTASAAMKRTNFFVSLCYLLVEVFIPGVVFYFLTSRDFSFAYFLSLGWMFAIVGLFIFYTIVVTLIIYKLKLHQLDQFTYSIPFACFISALYVSSYWLDYHYFLVRFIIGFVCAVVGVLLTSVVLLVFVNKKKTKHQF